MISPTFATIIIGVFIVIYGVVLPILNKKMSDYISYRWCVVVVLLALLIGVVIDFAELDDGLRRIILTGGLIITGGYVLLRTVEKALANGWLRGAKIEVSKGDIKAKITSDGGKNADQS